jgi:hypothetical protein
VGTTRRERAPERAEVGKSQDRYVLPRRLLARSAASPPAGGRTSELKDIDAKIADSRVAGELRVALAERGPTEGKDGTAGAPQGEQKVTVDVDLVRSGRSI